MWAEPEDEFTQNPFQRLTFHSRHATSPAAHRRVFNWMNPVWPDFAGPAFATRPKLELMSSMELTRQIHLLTTELHQRFCTGVGRVAGPIRI